MGKSRHRKKHKQKSKEFSQRLVEKNNKLRKLRAMFVEQYNQQKELSRKEYIVETILRNRKEFMVEVEGVYTLNENSVVEKDGVLYWKADNNPILAGLEPLEAYSQYTKELINQCLASIQTKEKMRVMEQAKLAYEQAQANGGQFPDLGLPTEGIPAEFTIVEDPTFELGKKKEEESFTLVEDPNFKNEDDIAVGDVNYTEEKSDKKD